MVRFHDKNTTRVSRRHERELTCSHHAPRSGRKGARGGKGEKKRKKERVRYTQEGTSRLASHAAPAMCVFLSPSAVPPPPPPSFVRQSPLSFFPLPPTPPPTRSDAHLILLSADRGYTCVRTRGECARACSVPYVCLYTNIR